MALVHDVAESLVGDITPHCGVSDADKHALEADAIGRIQDMLGRGTQAGEGFLGVVVRHGGGAASAARGNDVVWRARRSKQPRTPPAVAGTSTAMSCLVARGRNTRL